MAASRARRALVIEGGGSRAAYATGVVWALEDAGLSFDAVYGTSAGGALAAWFTAGQMEDAARTWDYARDPRLINYGRWVLGRGPAWSLDELYRGLYVNEVPLDVEAVRASRHPVWVTLTDADSGRTEYADLRGGDVLELLAATSAIPILAGDPVVVGGRRFLDGGISDPLPVRRALEDGATEVVAVSNRGVGEPHMPEGRLAVAMLARGYPALREVVRRRHLEHQASVRLGERAPAGVRMHFIRPARPLRLSRLTRDVARLRAAIAQGRTDGAVAARPLGEAGAGAAPGGTR